MLKVKLVNPTEAAKLLGQHHGLYNESRREYAVLQNGERFLFNAIHDGAEPRSITVVKNWKLLLEE